MKTAKKRTALLLVLCMLAAGLLSGCGKTEAPQATAPAETAAAQEEFTPTGENYGGDFVVLIGGKAGGDNVRHYGFAETDADSRTSLDEAVYRRNKAVEELYGVKLTSIEDAGSDSQVYNKLMMAATAGDSEYDLVQVAAYDAVPLAIANCLYELGSIKTLDLTKSWWDQKVNEQLVIDGLTFFTTGDISYWDDMQQNVIAFNKQVKRDLNIEDDFYTVLREGEWTLDKMAEYAKVATEDLNADGVYDMRDKFGIITWDDTVYAIFNAGGERVVRTDENGKLKLTITGSERAIDVLSKYTDICFGGDAINYQRYTANEAIEMFSTDRALFFFGRLQSLDHYRDMETDYGILPYPKYEASQKNYETVASPYHMAFFCVPYCVSDPAKSGAVADALAYYGKTTVTGAYYDKTLTGQYFRDEDSVYTLELMAQTRAYDLGFYLQPGNINKELIYLFRKGSKDFASAFAAKKNAAESALASYETAFELAKETWDTAEKAATGAAQ
ncbi:MAG: extracellular solute-binding protein [Clostridia bacterium]|nr:extracellular solute-binding protein [Clostridia bacterium]